ncbi:MAG: mandelate racemase/muconate lactonizing enzyme family protein [Gemmatimonadetes bacterium]|jgi:muconate cycloisomerase|nr:mandelate racemase/muconate lactonizing enzyme family protein [Gemmatimonadota bacterium]
MKITSFERTTVCVPFVPNILSTDEEWHVRPAYPENLDRRRHDVLRLHTDEGVVGLGMSTPYYGVREDQSPDWLGRDPLSFEPRSLAGGGWPMAMLDLIAKAHGVPLYRILGGKSQDRVLVDYWMHATSVEVSALAARRAHELGFHGIKTKGKLEDPLEDRFRAMTEAAPGIRIVMDPKERFYTLEQSLELARRVEDLDIVFEDPFPRDFNAYRRLKEETSVFIAMHLQTASQVVEAVSTQAVNGINVAPSDWAFLDMARIAATDDIPVWQASNVDLGIFDAYRIHASAAVPNCTLASDMIGNFVHEHSLLTEPLLQDGYAIVPQGPGLGVELDEDAVERYRVR